MQDINGRGVLTLSDSSALCAAAAQAERDSGGELEFDQIGRFALSEELDLELLRAEAVYLKELDPDVTDLCDMIIEAIDEGA